MRPINQWSAHAGLSQHAVSPSLTSLHCLPADTQTYTGFLLPNGTVNASQPNYNYTSPLFNHVTVGGLVPGTTVRLVDPAACKQQPIKSISRDLTINLSCSVSPCMLGHLGKQSCEAVDPAFDLGTAFTDLVQPCMLPASSEEQRNN